MRKLQFWYDLASNYAYLSAMRIEALAGAAKVEIVWRPFLLGPIFKAQGWDTSPFNIYPAKGRHMIRDMERSCVDRGLPPFTLPASFPARSLTAVRVAHVLEETDKAAAFSKAIFSASFAEGLDIGDEQVVAGVIRKSGLDASSTLRSAQSDRVKEGLRQRTEAAVAAGIFGAPSFVTETGELFWGDDRLDQALRWAARDLPIVIGQGPSRGSG